MKTITLTIDGKEYKAQMSEADVAEIEKPRTGYERVEGKQNYWMAGVAGAVASIEHHHKTDIDDERFNSGQYHNAEIIADNNARADRLMRRLRQWQALNDKPVDWSVKSYKYYLVYMYEFNDIGVDHNQTWRHTNNIYFSSEEKAKEAIDVFKDELLWYFTEYRQRLDESARDKAE